MGVLSKVVKVFALLSICFVTLFIISIFRYRRAPYSWQCIEHSEDMPLDKAHIPKHIHQLFFFITDNELPKKYHDTQSTWKEKNPGYGYTLWNSSMVDDLIRSKYPKFGPLYNSYDHWVKRADMARYLILHQFGGIYADIDIRCKKSMSHLNDTLTVDTSVVLRQTEEWGIPNDFIIAAPNHPFLGHVLKGLPNGNRWYVLPYATTLFSTGRMYLWGRLLSYSYQDEIYIVNNVSDYLDLMRDSSWYGWDGVVIRWVFTVSNLKYVFVVILAVVILLYCLLKQKRNTAVI